MAFELGQIVTWTLRTLGSNGLPGNLPELPTATVTLPDGTTAAATVAQGSTGVYTATLTSTQAGRHTVRWTSATANDDTPYTDVADVWPADPRLIMSLADARLTLNVPATDRSDNEDLRLYIAATTQVIESLTGPILTDTRTETHDGDGSATLFLGAYPTTVDEVTENGTTLASTYYALGRGGVLYRRIGCWSSLYAGNITVTYTVGGSPVPSNVLLAAREQLRHLWQVGRLPMRPALGGDPAPGYTTTPMGFAVPNRVIELLGDSQSAHHPRGVF